MALVKVWGVGATTYLGLGRNQPHYLHGEKKLARKKAYEYCKYMSRAMVTVWLSRQMSGSSSGSPQIRMAGARRNVSRSRDSVEQQLRRGTTSTAAGRTAVLSEQGLASTRSSKGDGDAKPLAPARAVARKANASRDAFARYSDEDSSDSYSSSDEESDGSSSWGSLESSFDSGEEGASKEEKNGTVVVSKRYPRRAGRGGDPKDGKQVMSKAFQTGFWAWLEQTAPLTFQTAGRYSRLVGIAMASLNQGEGIKMIHSMSDGQAFVATWGNAMDMAVHESANTHLRAGWTHFVAYVKTGSSSFSRPGDYPRRCPGVKRLSRPPPAAAKEQCAFPDRGVSSRLFALA